MNASPGGTPRRLPRQRTATQFMSGGYARMFRRIVDLIYGWSRTTCARVPLRTACRSRRFWYASIFKLYCRPNLCGVAESDPRYCFYKIFLDALAPRGVLMVAKSVKWALASLVIFSPAAAFGLGLGDIRLLSSLNAPLDAEIEVLGATPDEISNLKAQIASRELFAEKGLDFPSSLLTVTVSSTRTSDGRQIIRLRSRETMTEPFLTMLVEVNSTRSHLVREYSLLFD